MSEEPIPVVAQAAIKYWWLFLIQGAIALVIGALLVFKPDKSLEFVAVLLGIYVVFWGAVQIMSAFVLDDRRAMHVLIGFAAIVVGGLIIGAPDRTLRLVAVAAGIYLVVWGLVSLLALFGNRPDKKVRIIQGVLAAAAGIIVLALPDHSIAFVAIVFGIWLMVTAVMEIVGAMQLKRLAA